MSDSERRKGEFKFNALGIGPLLKKETHLVQYEKPRLLASPQLKKKNATRGLKTWQTYMKKNTHAIWIQQVH